VFLSASLKVELIDLGLSQDLKADPDVKPAGTLHSMSPEMAKLYLAHMTQQVPQEHTITFASDFYSMGVLAFELLNGKPPQEYFNQTQPKEEYLEKVIKESVEIESLDEDLADLISQLLIKDPSQRLASWPKLREHKCFQGFSVDPSQHEDLIDLISVTGRHRVTEVIDPAAQALFDEF